MDFGSECVSLIVSVSVSGSVSVSVSESVSLSANVSVNVNVNVSTRVGKCKHEAQTTPSPSSVRCIRACIWLYYVTD